MKENLNVIVVDWKDGALMPNYLNAASNTQVVAAKVALFIRDNQIDPKRVHCIGRKHIIKITKQTKYYLY